jgi:hypothetical protein
MIIYLLPVTKTKNPSCGKPSRIDWGPHNSLASTYTQKISLTKLISWLILKMTSLKLKLMGSIKAYQMTSHQIKMGSAMNSSRNAGQSSGKIFISYAKTFNKAQVCLRSINKSYITLIPKTDGAEHPLEFRPISLLNSSVKLITKLLANRLQAYITRLVHKNQYGSSNKGQFRIAWPGHLNI